MRTVVLFIFYYASAGYAVFNPLYGALFFTHITIFRPENLVWGNPIFGRLHLITALCTYVGYLVQQRHELRHGRHQTVNIVVFAIFAAWAWLISITATASVGQSVDRCLDITKIFFFCLLLSLTLTSVYRIRLYTLVVAGSSGLLGLWGVLQGMAGNWRLDNVWIAGSNELAAVLVLMAPFTLTAALDRGFPFRLRIGLGLCVLAITTCVTYTGSRGGFLGLAGGVLGLVLLARLKGTLLITVFAVAMLVYPLIPSDYGERMSTVTVSEGSEDPVDLSAASRPILWRLALRVWQDNPIFGVGLGNFSLVVSSYSDKASDLVTSGAMANLIFGVRREPHGLYTGLLAETGTLGFALFFMLVLRNVACRLGSRERDLVLLGKGAQAGILGFSIAALFGDYQYIDMLYWQLFLIGAILSNPASIQQNSSLITTGKDGQT